MNKYNQLKYLKKTKARVNHACLYCGKEIKSKSYYYVETIRDKFLFSLHPKKFCAECYRKYGDKLIA